MEKHTIILNVKDHSVHAFLEEKLTNKPEKSERGFIGQSDTSPYHLMRDELIFKKDCGIKVDERIQIQLQDVSQGSRKKLVNNYVYQAAEYDDVSISMQLVDFKVEYIAD